MAEAARQEQARKATQLKKNKHVYTEEDLKRAQILTPEDQAKVEATRNQTSPALAQESQKAGDARPVAGEVGNTAIAPVRDAPLGDVARRFRQQKLAQTPQRTPEFHLPSNPSGQAPVLASPKPMLRPALPPLSIPEPRQPRYSPSQPLVKRSPFSRPLPYAFGPPRRNRSQPVAPSPRLISPAAPVMSAPPISATPSLASPTPTVVTVKPGDSLWRIAEQHLGKGLRWRELLAVNPGIVDPDRIVAGSRLYLPASLRPLTKYTVRPGDSLSQIAQSQLGHASLALCIAQANPSISDADKIYPGQVLLLPASCKR